MSACECGCGGQTKIAVKTDARTGIVKGQALRFINGHNRRGIPCAKGHTKRRPAVMHTQGYVMIPVPTHPRASRYGYVLEHIVVAERALGHYLDAKHPVHHVDLARDNNENTNLVICEDAAYHNLLHKRTNEYQRSLRRSATGSVNNGTPIPAPIEARA